jgi:hypothetical protein
LLKVAGKLLPVNADLRQLQHHIYILDSTTVDLCLELFPWAVFRKHKAAVKLHTVLDAGRDLPLFVRVSPGKTHDLWLLDQIVERPGAIYVFDKAYIDFTRLNRLHQSGAFFVTRAKRNMDYKIIQRLPVPPGGAVRSDWLIRLRGPVSSRKFPHTLRLIKYVDPEKHKRLQFMTNHLALPSNTIALLYCKRWRIELFFKWIKQHLHIKRFFGVSPNAVKIQVWVAVIVYVLLALLKHRQQLSQSLNDIFQVLGVTLCE